MATKAVQSKITLDHFVHLCHGKGSFLIQQNAKILNLFNTLSQEKGLAPKNMNHLGWELAQLPSTAEEWIPVPPSDSNTAACWETAGKLLWLQYDENRNLQAYLQEKEKEPLLIPSQKIFIQWGTPYQDLTPRLDPATDCLYLTDQLENTEKILCSTQPTGYWKESDLIGAVEALQSYLKTQHKSRGYTPDQAERFQQCRNAVCRIVHPKGTGTGFVIGNRLLITNHHVLSDSQICLNSWAEFFYDTPEGLGKIRVDFDPDTFFVKSESPDEKGIFPLRSDKLDFTIVALKQEANPDPRLDNIFAHPISLDTSNSAQLGNGIFLIHHPIGKEKRVCLAEDGTNRIFKIEPLYVTHTASVDPGSSGAPLLSSALRIVALHRQALGLNPEQKAAVRMDSIVSYLKKDGGKDWSRILTEFKPLEKNAKRSSIPEVIGCCPSPPKDFTGRKEDLDKLHKSCTDNNRVAISGLGGVGKTALAFQYAKEHKQVYHFVHLIPSTTSQLMTQGLLELADDLKVPEDKDVINRLTMLKRKLDRLGNKYLLIFDGIDQVETFHEIEPYLPTQGNCILLTSRMPEQSRSVGCEVIPLDVLSDEDAVNFLLIATKSQEKEAARLLAQALGNFPLALTHEAGYMRSSGITIETYLELYKQHELKLFEDKNLTLSKEKRTILTTWHISMEAIAKTDVGLLSQEILKFFAFLAQAPIPLSLVKIWHKKFYLTDSNLEQALTQLCHYSMIRGEKDFYSIHLLVQDVTRYQLSKEERQVFFEQTLETLAMQAKTLNVESMQAWPVIKTLLPHAEKVMVGLEEGDLRQETGLALANLADYTGIWLQKILGHNKAALKYCKLALKYREKFLDKKHPDTASSYNNMGFTYGELGEYKQALEFKQKALAINIQVLGEEHSTTATSYNNVGLTYGELGEHKQALEFQQKALALGLKVLGDEHPYTAASYNNVGFTYGKLGDYKQALEFQQKALAIWFKVLGEEHPTIATSYNNVGSIYEELGEHKQALEFQQKALALRLKVLGDEHPDTALSYNNVGGAYGKLGDYKQALEYHQKALALRLKVLGDEHPDTALSYNNVGSTYGELGEPRQALEFLQKALDMRLKVLGGKHPNTAISYNNVGSTYGALGEHKQALEFQQKALAINLQVLGEEHPITALSYNNVGCTYGALGEHQQALEFLQKALAIRFKVLREEHPDIATSYANVGLMYRELGEPKQALRFFIKAWKFFHKIFGESHLNTKLCFTNAGITLFEILGNY